MTEIIPRLLFNHLTKASTLMNDNTQYGLRKLDDIYISATLLYTTYHLILPNHRFGVIAAYCSNF